MQGESLVWALRFQTLPQVIDDINEDTVFSPNEDGIQDRLLIGFVTDGDLGDFRIMIDTHGPGGVGTPDGRFDPEEDWVITGELGPAIDADDHPRAIREAWDGNDFSRQQSEKNPRPLRDGRYQIKVEIDALPNDSVNVTESGYVKREFSAVIDNMPPQLSASVSQHDFSPNGDSIREAIQIRYGISENLSELELRFINPSDQPALVLTRLTEGNHSFTWVGSDGLGTPLRDNAYALQLRGSDKGGNVGTYGIGTIQIDTEPPTISEITPSRNLFQNTSVEQIEAIFDIGDGSLIDFRSNFTTIILKNANGAQVDGVLSHNENASRLTLTLDQPLDSSEENGVYTIDVSGGDKAGNIVRDSINFTFDNVAPTITSIATDAGKLTSNASTTTKFTFVDVTLVDNIDTSVNFSNSMIRLNTLEGVSVAGNQRQFGEHGIRWTPGFSLATDGSDDGDYTITVQSQDRSGNVVEAQITFSYDTQAPELVSLTSEGGVHLNPSVGTKAFLNSSLSVVTATFDDESGGGVDFSKTAIGMVRLPRVGIVPAPVQGTLTPDEDDDTLKFRLNQPLERRNGSQDGTYRIRVALIDKAGNTETKNFEIAYDTQVPAIISTTPAENETVSSLSQVSVVLNANSGVNFSATGVKLLRTDGSEVSTGRHDNGRDTVSLTLAQALAIDGSEDGEYTIEITPVDGANNAGATVRRQFFIASRLPEIRLNTPTDTQISNLTTIDAQLFNYIGPGLDFAESKSTVTVSRNRTVIEAKPVITDEQSARLVWTIDRSLSRDGSADGEYTVNVQYTDLIGKTFTEDFMLTFDSQPPTITVGSRPQVANPLTTERIEVQLEVTDDFAGVQGSGFDAAASTFELFDVNGAMVNGAQTSDGTSRFAFRSSVLPEDGTYTLIVTLVDQAGNYSIPQRFIYDAEEPTIQAVSHIEMTLSVSNVSEFLTRVEATVSDAGTGIDFNRSTIQLLNVLGEVVPGSPYHDDEAIIGWELETPLTGEGNFDGLYSLRVSAVDKAGYVEERTFALRYDTQVPIIQTAFATQNDGTPVELSGVEAQLITSSINQITVRLSDGEGSGMDVLRTTVSLIGPEGTPVGTNQSDNGSDTVYLLFNPLRADGSDDGFYRVQVTPTDLAGNTLTSPVEFPFFYGTRKPEVISTTPANFASVTQLTEVSAILGDHSGEGIDFDRTTIFLKTPDQSLIPGHQTVEEAQSSITWELNQPLSRDGSADGEYSIQLSLFDKVGNSADVEYTFVYDTFIPTIVSVMANTNPSTVIPSNGLTAIESSFDGMTIKFSDANGETTPVSGIDLVGTNVQLVGPGNVPLGINTHDDGVATITVSFVSLRQPGTYTVQIVPRDMAGNVSSHAIEYEFSLELRHSTVPVVTISGQMAPVEFVNKLDEIIATLEDVSDTGLNLAPDGSTIAVTGPDGQVEGIQTARGENQIVWRPLQLATDGSADGIYTVTITPVNSGGRLGIPARYQFTLDTQEPEVASVTPIDLTQPLSYIGQQLIQIVAQVEDVGPAGLDVEDQRLQLRDAGGNIVPAVQTNDEEAQIFLTFSQPLATDGSNDGVYTVSLELTDKAGNLNLLSHQFVYDTLIPTVVSVTANTNLVTQSDGTLIELSGVETQLITSPINQITVGFSDGEGSGMDVLRTTVSLVGPEGTPVGANQTDNGVDTVLLSFNPLRADGSDDGFYRVQVTPTDLAGNTLTSPVKFPFFYGTRKPEVISTTPANFASVTQLTEVSAILGDHSGEGIDFDRTTIFLKTPDQSLIPGHQTVEEAQSSITWELNQPLSRDGSADGEYSIQLSLFDKVGNSADVEYTFVYDTFIPTIVSVMANTNPSTVIPSNGLTAIESSFDGMTIKFSDANGETTPVSGIDLVGTNVQLVGPGNVPLGINTHDDGVATITVSFVSLRQPGTYTVQIVPRDMAGNVSSHAIEYEFSLELRHSTVPVVTISGQMAPVEFVNKLDEIIATLEDVSGTGLNLAPDGSTIAVTGPDGQVEGIQTARGENQIVWRPLQLATDGSADGIYTVTITPVNSGGRLGIPARYQFTLDTQEPEVASVTPIDLTQPLSYIGQQLIQIVAQVEDVGPAGLDVEDQRLQLRDAGGNIVPAVQTNDEEAQIFLTFSQPFATDGSNDGVYTVSLELTDKAGNLNLLSHQFVYDTLIPTVVSVTANTNPPTVLLPDEFAAIEQPFEGLTINLSDVNGETTPASGIDLIGTSVQLFGPGDTLLGLNTRDDGVDTITVSFARLYQPGTYTVEITPRDLAGNVSRHAIEYTFNLELGRSTVSAVTISGQVAPVEFVNKLDAIVAMLEDASAIGLNLTSDGSTITVTGPDGQVEGVQTARGENQIAWRPLQLATDGSADGIYTVTIIPVNSDGRLGIPARYQFTLDTQEPEVASVTPIDLTQPLSYISQQLIQIAAQIEDVGPAGLEVDDQRLQLLDAGGNLVPAVQTNDRESQIFLTLSQPLAADGSDDGVYTVSIELTDKADNLNSFLHEFVYDTLIPTVTSVTTNTDPPTVLLPDEFAAIEQPFDGLTVELSDANSETTSVSGIDLGDTGIQLLGPGSTPLGINTRDDGLDTITVSFASLYQLGTYTLEITPRDLAGNVSRHAIEYKFNLELGRATVSAVTIDGQMAPVEFVNRLDEIVATFENLSATGLNLTSAGSTITVTGPNGEVEGVQTSRGENQIAWRPLQLATDGSADGVYTVTVTPVNNGGRLGIPARHQFTLDTQEPEVASVTPIDLTQPLSYIGQQLIQIVAQVEDVGPAGLDVEDQRLQLRDAGGNIVPAVQTNDEEAQIFLTFSQPFATDGSNDGVYTVSLELTDKAGNLNLLSHQFVYDTLIPTVVSVTANTNPPTVLLPDEFAAIEQPFEGLTINLSDVNGETTPASGIDLIGTSVQLFGPGDTLLGLNTRDDGVDTITVSFARLYQPGTYTVEITPRDLAGNVSRHAIEYTFNLELGRSTVSAVTISGQVAPVEFVNKLDAIVAMLEDASAIGLNLTSDGSTITVTGPDGQVEGVQTARGENQIAWRPLQLATDGSADGIYTVTIIPVNSDGRLGIPARYQFTLDTQEPEVASVTPIDLTQPLSYISQQLIQIVAQIEDVGPAGLEVDDQRLQLLDAGGNLVPAVQTNDGESQIFLTLSQPLATDGSDDGVYTVTLDLMDKAGNLNSLSRQLIHDTSIPTVISVIANTDPPTVIPSNGLTAIETSFNGLTIKLSDANGETTPVSGIDLVGTGVQLLGPGKTPLSINTRDDGVDTITVSFASLYQPGTYTLEITPQDMAGNISSHAIEYEFGLELGHSVVSAVTIGGRMVPAEFVNRLDEIVATLEDVSATGLNLTSDGSAITVAGPDGEVEGIQTSRGGNQIVWRPLQLATDGSADGIYTATVTPVNSGGRLGIPARYQFTFDTREPEVTLVTPIDLTQPLSYIGRQLIQIAAQVEDVGPAGLEVEDQRLQLLDAGGNVVPAVQTNDGESQIFLTLSQPLTADGSDDGGYTVTLDLIDKAGNLNPISHQLVYDTQAPTLVSTNPTDGSLRSDDITLITARLNDVGGSGINFAESMLTLLDSTGTPVSGVQSNDGNRRLTLQIGGLVADGNYTIRVQAIDRAGNGSTASFKTQFTYSSGMPVVISTVPKTTPAEEAFTNKPFRQVSVELQSENGGVDRSTVALLTPDGTIVPGQQVRRGKLLIYRLLREFATDGSDDGTYTIVVVPINSAGRQGEPRQFTFAYDTVAPEVIPASIQLIVAEPGVNNSLVSVGALITDDDPRSGVDWDNLDLSWITLGDVTRNRKIEGTLATDEEQALLLNLIMPLASDGSQDGVYLLTIAPKDRAGNVSEAVSYPFFYDTRPPTIDTSSLFIDGQPLLTDSNDPYYPSATNKSGSIIIDAKFSDINPDGSYGLGPDLVNSSISVSSPSGEVITGTTTQNGTDSIRFKSGPLDEQGHYQVTITSVGSDAANLGFQPTDSVTTQFLFETTKPIVELTDLVGETTFEDEPLPLQGTARDPSEEDIPASEVAMVEVVGTGPDGLAIDPVAAKDDSEEEEDPWSRWSIDFLPSQSGEYNLDVRVTDRAGNAGIYDAVTVNFSVSLIFKGPTYVWPNPLSLSRRSNDEIAHFSFEVNVPGGEGARIVLSIYDFAGDLVYEKEYNDLGTGRSDNEVRWDLTNQSGTDVARGIYIFRLEAEDVVTSNRTNAVGKIVVVE